MELFFYTFLGILGAIFGSFASVVIYRIKSKEKGIFTGRSHCPRCMHQLKTYDLFPLFSFLSTGGKCRYCKSEIPFTYPLLELTMAGIFAMIGYFMINVEKIFFPIGMSDEWLKLLVLLVLAFCTVVYVFYDILYMEIPESILAIANITALFYLFYLALVHGNFSYLEIGTFTTATGIIFITLYAIMLQEKEEKMDILLLGGIGVLTIFLYSYFGIKIFDFQPLEGILAGYTMFVFFYIQYYISGGAWIGGGDFRIAILMGLMLGFSYLLTGFFATYICGSIVGLSVLFFKYLKTGKLKENMMIPFGPFLAFGIFFALFFGSDIKMLVNLYL